MRVVGLLSGGKDSCFNLLHCVAHGHEIVAVAHLAPPAGQDELDSYMYQTVGHEAIALIAQCLGLPLYTETIRGSSVARERDYVPTAADEVEDLARLLQRVQAAHANVQGVAVGAILSDYQRTRVEHVCRRLGLTALAYLWQEDQRVLVETMLALEMEPVVVKVAAYGLDPARHLGQPLRALLPHLLRLRAHLKHAEYDVHIAGEGGEYETLTLDCPLFARQRLVIVEAKRVLHSADGLVGYLQLARLALTDKPPSKCVPPDALLFPAGDGTGLRLRVPGPDGPLGQLCRTLPALLAPYEAAFDAGTGALPTSTADATAPSPTKAETPMGRAVVAGPWTVLVNVASPPAVAAPEAAATAALDAMQALLIEHGVALVHVVALTAVVASMADYAEINRAYARYFGLNPPARVAIAVSGGPLVTFHAIAHRSLAHPARHTLHVQSISHWAPANIAPYSQAVATDSALWIAGQIPLVSATMDLLASSMATGRPSWALTARHAWTVLARMGPAPGRLLVGTAWLVDAASLADYRPWWAAVWEAVAPAEPPPLLVVAACEALPRNADVEVAWLAARHNREALAATVADDDALTPAEAARAWPLDDCTWRPRTGVTVRRLARSGSALWAALAEYTANAGNDAAAVAADLADCTAGASPHMHATVYVPGDSRWACNLPASIVPVRALEPGIQLAWTCWGIRAPLSDGVRSPGPVH